MAWLLPEAGSRVLDLCSGKGAFTRDLVSEGHRVFGITTDAATAELIATRVAAATILRARPTQMPFRPRWFDAITIADDRPNIPEVFPEAVRVLRPGGHLALLRTTRDDTVPWVRRLAALIQTHDPTAMTSTTTGPTEEELLADGWFVATDAKAFRLWVPVDRRTLLAMVERRLPVQKLDDTAHRNLLADVGMLFDDIARGHEVKLPYRIECRKAWPDPDRQAAEPSVTIGIHLHW
ncbi:Methyltransferase domain-containing protein [Raineyella antarctica]|uniref:Methyltransferase domain-containing protein n=2 Tax=Raineyella antarctica TaxID=1577474 RepID=A0A1G6GFL3_9ACTN|nr:Methyltransferase domain-containing protein [Raineyella antarctica]